MSTKKLQYHQKKPKKKYATLKKNRQMCTCLKCLNDFTIFCLYNTCIKQNCFSDINKGAHLHMLFKEPRYDLR